MSRIEEWRPGCEREERKFETYRSRLPMVSREGGRCRGFPHTTVVSIFARQDGCCGGGGDRAARGVKREKIERERRTRAERRRTGRGG